MTSQPPTSNAAPDSGLQDQLRQEKVGALVMAARRALRRGDKVTAKTELQKALKMDVNDCGALELLGEFYMAEGEQEKAIEVLEKGHKLYPKHAAFEKNIALCILDLEEMKRGKTQAATLNGEDPDAWMDRKPLYAAVFSIIPGAGQVYNGDNISAAIIFGIWLVTSILWYSLLMNAMGQLPLHTPHTLSLASAQMGGFTRGVFWLSLAINIGAGVYAFFDAIAGANRANARRRQERSIL
jgi:TM2 domain-containing membrane protein YozV